MSVCTIFVFMALMEYCLVNIVLGDTALPKPIPPPAPPAPPAPPKENVLMEYSNSRVKDIKTCLKLNYLVVSFISEQPTTWEIWKRRLNTLGAKAKYISAALISPKQSTNWYSRSIYNNPRQNPKTNPSATTSTSRNSNRPLLSRLFSIPIHFAQ